MLHIGRRIAGGTANGGSTGYGSPAPSTGYTGTGTQRSTRLAASDYNKSAQQSPMPHRQTPSVEADEDGEGEDDDGNEEDGNLYCFCQKLSYGTVGIRRRRSQHTWLTIDYPQMVGCDDEDCRFQWVTSIPRPRVSPIALNPSFSSTWVCWSQRSPRGWLVLS
jgi:chromatin modification-related protein YNG2